MPQVSVETLHDYKEVALILQEHVKQGWGIARNFGFNSLLLELLHDLDFSDGLDYAVLVLGEVSDELDSHKLSCA